MCELVRRASVKLDHLSSLWRQQTVDSAGDCDQTTSVGTDVDRMIHVFGNRCWRHFFPEPPVGAVHRKVAGSFDCEMWTLWVILLL
jgi:hypothetical protein